MSTTGKCVDNPALGIVGCGATYGGESQHCVASVPWSKLADGRAHVTGTLSTIDRLWGRGSVLRNPSRLKEFWTDERGVTRRWRELPDGIHAQTATIADTQSERAA